MIINDLYFKYNDDIIFDNISINIKNNVTCIIGPSGSGKTTLAQIMFLNKNNILKTALLNKNVILNKSKSSNKQNIIEYFGNTECLNNKYLMKLVDYLADDYGFIIIDEVFSEFSNDIKTKIVKYAKKYNIFIVYFTNDIENSLYSDYMFVIGLRKILIEGKTTSVLKEEKILKRLGIGLPIIVDLSAQLKSYNVVNNISYNVEDLVDSIWK